MTFSLVTCIRRLGYIVAAAIILFALLVNIGYMASPILNDHRADIEKWTSQLLQSPVAISHIQFSWHALHPGISLEAVTIFNSQTHQPAWHIKQVEIDMAVWRSLLTLKPQAAAIVIRGVNVTLHQLNAKKIRIDGVTEVTLADNLTAASTEENAIFNWLLSQPHLALQEIAVRYIGVDNHEKNITVADLSLENANNAHSLQGDAILHQDVPTKAHVSLQWHGDIRDLSTVSAEAYVYLQGVSVGQWLTAPAWHQLQLKQALGSAKVWVSWRHQHWQKAKAKFKFYDVKLYQVTTKKSQTLTRFSGQVDWKRDGDHYLINGEQILIDLPHHLWPMTNFSVTLTSQPDDKFLLEKIETGYFDLHDVATFLLNSDLLPAATQQVFIDLNPQGAVQACQAATSSSWSLLDQISLNIELTDAGMNAIEKFPGIKNFSGRLYWSGTRGRIKINSNRITVTLKNLFPHPLFFDQLLADAAVVKDDQGTWLLNIKNVMADNVDIHLLGGMTLSIPATASPVIDLSAIFQAKQVAQFVNYLPLQTFSADLAHWLKNAFLSGQIVSGKALVQGRLADFPFEHKPGKFAISGDIVDVDFRYAPNWPIVNHFNGKLNFVGRSMTAEMQSGEVLGIAIKNARGFIPTLGENVPALLQVNGDLVGDTRAVMHFIQESPLKKRLGNNVNAAKLSGPMQLKLSLSVPLQTPEMTQVVGDVHLQAIEFNLPESKIDFTGINGALHFTENSVTSEGLQGKLFNEPTTLTLKTQQDEANQPSYVQADIQGKINVSALQALSTMPLTKYVQGGINYQAKINLYSAEDARPTQLLMSSDLKGLSVNLPKPYDKPMDEVRLSQLEILMANSEPLRARIHYGKLFSFAASLKKTATGLTLWGGNFSVGREANWPTEPGLMLSGKLDTLDWDTIQSYLSGKKTKNTPEAAIILPDIRAVDLDVDLLTVWGQRLTHVRIQVTKAVNGLQVYLRNEKVVGQLFLPHHAAGAVQARFQRLYLDSFQAIHTHSIDPKSFPAFSFVGEDVRLGNKLLGRVAIDAVPNQTGLMMNSLYVDSALLQVRAKGEWSEINHQVSSALEGTAYTANVSQLLNQWGYELKNLVANKANAQFNLKWSGALYDPALSVLSGNISLKLGEGRILSVSNDAQLGLGRILNIFSLNTLPRRLSLDFSDIFQKGYSFDTMQGDFSLQKGDAFTQNMRIDGPIARVDIHGRLGLVNKDIDLSISVTPYVTSSLPVVIGVVTFPVTGPFAGIAAWAAERIVGRTVSKVVTHRYVVTGSWDTPIWTEGAGRR